MMKNDELNRENVALESKTYWILRLTKSSFFNYIVNPMPMYNEHKFEAKVVTVQTM